MEPHVSLACEQEEGKEREEVRGRERREPVGMAKHFDFQMPVLMSCSK